MKRKHINQPDRSTPIAVAAAAGITLGLAIAATTSIANQPEINTSAQTESVRE